MCKTLSSFEQLGSFMKNMKRVDSNLFEILSNERASEDSRKQALKDLEAKVSSILKTLESADYLFGTEEKSIYNDYCRNLAAFSLAASTDKKLSRVMLALEMLLENMAPDFKTELRTLKKSVKEGEFVVDSFGYCWDDLKLPFFANQFAQRFIATAISAVAKPQVVVVEKPVVVEKIVERVVEKPVIVEKQVFIEKPIDPRKIPIISE